MKLLSQSHSPYARKVLVLIHELSLQHIAIEHHETSPTTYNADIFSVNPMGQVPVLITDDGQKIFDSEVICDFLCTVHKAEQILPREPIERAGVLREQAIASGMCEAGIAVRWETERRPTELRYPKLKDGQILKLKSSYAFLESNANLDDNLTLGSIALACALDWLAFRKLDVYAENTPRLFAWLDHMRLRPSMKATAYSGNTID